MKGRVKLTRPMNCPCKLMLAKLASADVTGLHEQSNNGKLDFRAFRDEERLLVVSCTASRWRVLTRPDYREAFPELGPINR